MKTLAIKDWADNFQLSQNARIGRWGRLPIPIRLDGEHYRRLMSTARGRECYTVFIALAAVAANMTPRGVLAKDGEPMSDDALNIRTGIPIKALRAAIETLKSKEVGWLIETELGPPVVGVQAESAPTTLRSSQTSQPNQPALALAKPPAKREPSETAVADACASIGSEAAGSNGHRAPNLEIVRALKAFWPEGRTAQSLAGHENATPLRVLWLLERAGTEKMRKPGNDGKAGFVRTGIEEGWDVDPEWINRNRPKLTRVGVLSA